MSVSVSISSVEGCLRLCTTYKFAFSYLHLLSLFCISSACQQTYWVYTGGGSLRNIEAAGVSRPSLMNHYSTLRFHHNVIWEISKVLLWLLYLRNGAI